MIHKKLIKLWIVVMFICNHTQIQAQLWNPSHSIGTIDGVYHFSYNQIPSQLVVLQAPSASTAGMTYVWEQSIYPTTGFTAISGATQSSYTFTAALSQTTYFRRKTISSGVIFTYSNVIKISVVSIHWEDRNYIREHGVTTTAITTWQAVDQLPIGQKLQSTTYLDGLGRSIQQISKETATPANVNNLWGDIVQFTEYDVYGRQPKNYLPYTTTSQTGKFKTSPQIEQTQYYSTTYNETSAFSQVSFNNSPLNLTTTVKTPGTTWAASAGNSLNYELNTLADDVKIFAINYVQGAAPYLEMNYPSGTYPANSLYKSVYIDENGKKVIEFIDKTGLMILKKVQLEDNPTHAYYGWICTYFIYDHFGLLRYQLEPEAVNYLVSNNWSFAGNGVTVLSELCFQYNYDDKGRMIWKKTPGALPLTMLYDKRDRLVLTQDGNQSNLTPPQLTATVYDELDRPVFTTLYNTSKTITTLQADINNAPAKLDLSIANSANTGGGTIVVNSSLSPLTSTDLNSTSTTTVLKYIFYDHYSFLHVKTFNNGFTNLSAYNTTDPNVQPIAASNSTLGMVTGSKTRILGTYNFLNASKYYDRRGSFLQGLQDNVKSGTDITTLQYHFDGRLLSSCTDHTTSASGYTNFKILTKFNHDKLGRVISIQKQFGANAFKTVSSYVYDDVGRIKTKILDPGYTGSGGTELESLKYSYNLHSQLTGINKDYALKTSGTYNKWGNFFGMYLGYDNKDNAFASARLNGQLTGVIWNTQGDDAQRKYDYSYDNAGRLTKAAFTEKQTASSSWINTKMDFSVSGSSGKITYDLNGNLLTMLQKGVLPGSASPITIDDLQYSYASFSNKLSKVTDQMTTTASNGSFGDFKDGSNGTNPDYVYDNNGNVVIDLNKNVKDLNQVVGANGIRYNYLDKPDLIRIAGKGTISVIYSGSGEKLKRIFTPDSGPAVTTTYINQFVYQQIAGSADALSFISFEEGRVRVITPTAQDNGFDMLSVNGNLDLPNSKKGAWDYFILDYQQNVRMILSEEIRQSSSTASMETTRSTTESAIFGQTGAGNEVEATRFPKPLSWSGNTSASVSRLGNLAGKNIGPNTLQKVMAGDVIHAQVQYYFDQQASGYNSSFVSTILNSLIQALSAGPTSSVVKSRATNINTQLSTDNGFINAVQPSTGTGTTPLAYLTVLFFDERFNLVSATNGGVVQQQVASSVGSNGSTIALLNIKAPKNGYIYAYISNQSDQHVYFDNFAVSVKQGHIIEENHYYSFGLKISAISSKKYSDSYDGDIKNNYQMQGAYSEMDDDIGWNDFMLRNYDPQIGRWMQQDPYQQYASPYVGMGNDPVNLIDPSGGIACPGTSALSIFLENAVHAVGNALQSVSKIISIAGKVSAVTQTGFTAAKAIKGSNMINQQMETQAVGGYPLYSSEDAAAYGWSKTFASYGDASIEYSGEIYKIVIDNNTYYGFTRAVRFPDKVAKEDHSPVTQSPGPSDNLHNSTLPPRAVRVGHIHIHYKAAPGSVNEHFSEKDWGLIRKYGSRNFYLLNKIGELKVYRRRSEQPSNKKSPFTIASGFYYPKDAIYKGKVLRKIAVPNLNEMKNVPTLDDLKPVMIINPISGEKM